MERERGVTFQAVAERFITERLVDQRTATATTNEIRKHLIARWGKRPVTSISIDDAIKLCDDFRTTGIGAHAHNVVGHARRVFRWSIAKRAFGVDRNPFEGLDLSVLIGAKKARDRILTNAELKAVWNASGRLEYPYAPVFRLLMLTGARRSEVAEARWPEFDIANRQWLIPPARHKGGRGLLVPLSSSALAIVSSLPRYTGGDCVFTTSNGVSPVDGFSKVKQRLDRFVREELGIDPAPWVVHDIRRSVRSQLSELRVPPVVAESVIGHALPGLLGTYDRHSYVDEKRDALDRWAIRLGEIVETNG